MLREVMRAVNELVQVRSDPTLKLGDGRSEQLTFPHELNEVSQLSLNDFSDRVALPIARAIQAKSKGLIVSGPLKDFQNPFCTVLWDGGLCMRLYVAVDYINDERMGRFDILWAQS